MIPINPFTLGAASLGISKLAEVAQPIADFALRGFRPTQPTEESAEPARLGTREQLANDAQGALLEFARQLEDKLAELGVTLDSPVELQRSASGRVVVANAHAQKKTVEDLLSGTQLGDLFNQAAAKFQQLESYPESQIHADAPRTFQLRYGSGELHAGFVA
jgi:hypothetical protein